MVNSISCTGYGVPYTACMAKKGIKIKELAEELGVTARTVVARCRAEGLTVQNSITRLKPEQERIVRAWFVHGDDDGRQDENGTRTTRGENGELRMEN